MERHVSATDNGALEHAAHTLKGVAATIGARILADLAATIEKRAKTPEGLEGVSDLLGETGMELARLVSTIEMALAASASVEQPEQVIENVSPEVLAPLFERAVALLLVFDSAVEKVVAKLTPLASTPPRRERLHAIQKTLDAYDFETCLSLFRAWAQEEGIRLEDA